MRGDVLSHSTDHDHLESGQLGTADVTASTVANIGPGIDFYFGFGVIAATAGVAAPLTILAPRWPSRCWLPRSRSSPCRAGWWR
jgi:hypothetical protein